MNQAELFKTYPPQNVGNKDKSLLDVVTRFENNEIITPDYQRKFVWNAKKIKGWIQTVITRQAIGVLVTYQVKGLGPIYIADGLQRITATSLFIQEPMEYGFKFSIEQAKEYCYDFDVTIQHRHYDSHRDAMRAFQYLNMGTTLTGAEFFKGELTLSDKGALVYEAVQEIVDNSEIRVTQSANPGRGGSAKYVRDSLALFHQYISGTTRKAYPGYGSKDVGKTQVEMILSDELDKHTIGNLKKHLASFRRYLHNQVAMIEEIVLDTAERKPISKALTRHLLHLSIYRKNNNIPTESFRQYTSALLRILNEQTDKPFYGTRLVLPDKLDSEKFNLITLRADLFHVGVLAISEYAGIKFQREVIEKKPTILGFHSSHKVPVSTHGDGETFLEPAPLNMSRGAKPVEDK